MGKKNRKEKQGEPRANRSVRQKVDDEMVVLRHVNNKGYDVEMIRDFLENLLLEVRFRHVALLEDLALLKKTDDVREKSKENNEIESSALMEELGMYLEKYETQLTATDFTEAENLSPEETKAATEVLLLAEIERRSEQICHLEGLQELFDEALLCAKLPWYIDSDGYPVFPYRKWTLRKTD